MPGEQKAPCCPLSGNVPAASDVQRYALAPGLPPDTEHPVFRCKLHISVGDRGAAADMRQLRQLLSHVGIGVHLFPVKASAGIRIIAARHVFVS